MQLIFLKPDVIKLLLPPLFNIKEGKQYKELNYLTEQAKKLIDFDQDLTLDQESIHKLDS